LKERYYFYDISVHGRIILKWIFKKYDGKTWGSIDVAQDKRQFAGFCQGNNEVSGFIKFGGL
jgi:hypothetical protein